MKKETALILLAVVALAVLPLLIHWNQEEKFAGADEQAEKVITMIRPDYKPWFRSVWEPPSSEVASLLFALQAALGAGVLGYYFGLARGRASSNRR